MPCPRLRLAVTVTALVLFAGARVAWPCCQLGGTECGDPFAVSCNNGVVCPIPFRTCPNCVCTITNGGQTCLATDSQPGRVPGLRVGKSVVTPGDLSLDWDPSCSPAASDYSVHEGTIGVWNLLDSLQCSTGGSLATTVAPSAGDRYYLVAPISGDWTGSLGTNSANVERPDSGSSCTSDRAIAPCP